MRDLLCAMLRGERVQWPDANRATAIFDAAREQGVHVLVADTLAGRGPAAACPPEFRARAAAAARQSAAIQPVIQRELRATLAALAAAGATPLVFKGAALVHTHYAGLALRPHDDVDLLICPADVATVQTVLERRGYRRETLVSGDLVMSQAAFQKVDEYGVRHVVDVHWRLTNVQRFSRLFSFEELSARAVPLLPLGRYARTLSPIDALAVACVHRVAHHQGRDTLIWFYDIHLLAGQLPPAGAAAFIRLAREKAIRGVCADGIARAQALFHTALPGGLLSALATDDPQGSYYKGVGDGDEYLRGGMRKVDVLLSDLRALGSWSSQLRLLREHLFPPAAYMQEVYGVSSRVWLPVYYAARFASGIAEWFRRPVPRTGGM